MNVPQYAKPVRRQPTVMGLRIDADYDDLGPEFDGLTKRLPFVGRLVPVQLNADVALAFIMPFTRATDPQEVINQLTKEDAS